MKIYPDLIFLQVILYAHCVCVLLCKTGKGIYNKSHTSRTPTDFHEIAHIFYT